MDSIPHEIKQIIAAFLDINSKLRIRSTNKEWLKITAFNECICYSINEQKLNDIVATLEKIDKPISLDLRKNVIQDLPEITAKITRLTNLTGLSIQTISNYLQEEWMVLTVLKGLKNIHVGRKLLKFNPCLPNLEVAAIFSDGSFDISNMTRLQQLRIDLVGKKNSPTELSSFEKLTKLQLEVMTQERNSISMQNLTDLRELVTAGAKFHSLNSTNLTSLTLRGILPDDAYISSLVNLKYFELSLLNIRDEDKPDNYQFLTALTMLEEFILKVIPPPDEEILPYFNSTKLWNFVAPMNEIALSTLSKLTSLRSLEVSISNDSELIDLQPTLNLTKLNLKCTKKDTNVDLSNYTKLQSLRVICGSATKLVFPTSLTDLEINGESTINTVAVDLSNLPNLEVLSIGQGGRYAGLDKLTNLTKISIHTRSFTDCNFISNFSKLKTAHCSAPLPIIDDLVNATNLEDLWAKVHITNSNQLEKIAKFGHLTSLVLQSKRFQKRTDLIYTPITRLTNLQYLRYGESCGLKQFQAFLPRLWEPCDDE